MERFEVRDSAGNVYGYRMRSDEADQLITLLGQTLGLALDKFSIGMMDTRAN
jgi:hypothetical protein